MPAQISHILLGLEALTGLPSGWAARLSGPAFRLGCQGPDVFYHNRRTKPGAFLYGTRLHRRGWGTFLARFRSLAMDRGWGPDHPGMAFLVGHATHGFLDRHCHPFIVFFSGWRVPGRPETDILGHSHAFLERIIDGLLWKQKMAGNLAECDWQQGLPGPDDFPDDFWLVWAEALHNVFPKLSARAEVEARLKNAVLDTRGFLGHTSPMARDQAMRAARLGALHWFHPEDLPKWDFLNLAHGSWQDPVTGLPRTESLTDLFDRAAVQARGLLSSILDPRADWEVQAGNGSLNLPGDEGENTAPRFSRPWDFAKLYDREVRSRLGRA